MRISIVAVVLVSVVAASEARADGFLSLDSVHLDARGHFFFGGDERDVQGAPIGVDAEVQLDLVSSVDLSLSSGVFYGVGGDLWNFNIPFLAGLVYNFSQGSKSPFLGASFGAVITKVDNVDSEINAGLELSGGYEMSTLRLKAGLMIFDLGHAGDSVAAFAALGFNLR